MAYSSPETRKAAPPGSHQCICRCYSSPRTKAHHTLTLLGSFTKLEVGRDEANEEMLAKSMNKDAKTALLLWLAAKALPWKPRGLKARVECNMCSAMWKKDLHEMWQRADATAQKRILEQLEAETEVELGTFSGLIDATSANRSAKGNINRENYVKGEMDELWSKYFKEWANEHPRTE